MRICFFGNTTFSRTAPELELGYSKEDLVEGRRHKKLTTTENILADALIPALDRVAIKEALENEDPEGKRLPYVDIYSADHGFICEQRESFDAEASQFAWRLLLEHLKT